MHRHLLIGLFAFSCAEKQSDGTEPDSEHSADHTGDSGQDTDVDTDSDDTGASKPTDDTGKTKPTDDTGQTDDTGAQKKPQPSDAELAANAMVDAANAFLASLDAEQLDTVSFDLSDDERRDWSNLPPRMYERQGLSFEDMTEKQALLGLALLEASLSTQGYQKAHDIILIEALLEQGGDDMANADLYYFDIFDTPSMDAPWGWQFDGHHLALNFTAVADDVTFSPSLWGISPITWAEGKYEGLRPMPDEEDLAWELAATLTEKQMETARQSNTTPSDLVAGPGNDDAIPEIVGLPVIDMTEKQQDIIRAIIVTYVGNLNDAHAALRLAEIEANFEDIHLAWMGDAVEGRQMYYRIHGSRVFIEFDHGGINHFHSVYRDPANDYGVDWLAEHKKKFH